MDQRRNQKSLAVSSFLCSEAQLRLHVLQNLDVFDVLVLMWDLDSLQSLLNLCVLLLRFCLLWRILEEPGLAGQSLSIQRFLMTAVSAFIRCDSSVSLTRVDIAVTHFSSFKLF